MPLGAFRINTLAKTQAVAVSPRTSPSVSITAQDDAQISTAQYKFGGSSVIFDGTGDYLTTDLTPSFETTDFTIELFYRPISRQGSFPCIISHLPDTGAEAGVWALYDRHNAYSTKFVFYWRTNANAWATPLVSTTTVSNGTWYHIAIVRESTSIKMYIDGTLEDTGTIDATWTNPSDVIRIGTEQTNYTNGYMDEIRISDAARYTASFTAPTAAFEPDGDTVLLIHGEGINGSREIIDDPAHNDLRAIDTQNSYYLNGTVSANTTDSYDITISYWFRHSASQTDLDPAILLATNTAVTSYLVLEYTGGRIRCVANDGDNGGRAMDFRIGTYSASYGSGTYDDGAWHHFLMSIDGSANTAHAYVDGTSVTITKQTDNITTRQVWNGTDFDNISICSNHAQSDTRIIDRDITQLFVDNVYYDITDSTVREKFYNGGAINMGSDGTASGLDQPLIFHQGDTSDFELEGGDQTAFPYTVTQNGTGADISSANGPQGA